jgi:hypothetical protein
MSNRPCKPSDDVERIWLLLLPDTPFPACGTQEDNAADAHNSVAPANESRADATRRAGPRARRD